MNNKDQRRTQSFRRVQGWAVAHPDIMRAAPAPVVTHLKTLDGVVFTLETNAATQDAQHGLSTRSATDAKLRRTAVRDAMRPITQLAKGLTGTVLGISSISKMAKTHADNETLVTAANSMVENAMSFKDVLIAHGAQPGCIETLQTAAAALKSSIDARGQAKAAGVGATKGIKTALVSGKTVVSFLDAALMPQLKSDSVALASWRNAKRVTTKGVVGVVVSPATTPAGAATSTTPTAVTAASTVTATPVAAAAAAVTVAPTVTATPVVAAAPAGITVHSA